MNYVEKFDKLTGEKYAEYAVTEPFEVDGITYYPPIRLTDDDFVGPRFVTNYSVLSEQYPPFYRIPAPVIEYRDDHQILKCPLCSHLEFEFGEHVRKCKPDLIVVEYDDTDALEINA